jgi:hypothetical protein
MFKFESFHMYGIIMTAVVTGVIGIQIIKEKHKDIDGLPIAIADKENGNARYLNRRNPFGLVGHCRCLS